MSEKTALVIYFPVQPHVYKYLQKKVGEKLIVSKQSFYGNLVLDILSKRYSVLAAVSDDLQFPVEISMRYMQDYGIYMNNTIVRKFNSQIDKIFREEMRTYVSLSYRANGIPKNMALKQLLLDYNITEEDIKLETLIKDIVRNAA